MSKIPLDAECTKQLPEKRVVLTPDPLIDTPVAAAAWGWTYKAQCVDVPTLLQFAAAHYNQGPEDTCEDGTAEF